MGKKIKEDNTIKEINTSTVKTEETFTPVPEYNLVKPGDRIHAAYRAIPDIKIGSIFMDFNNLESEVPKDIDTIDLMKLNKLVKSGVLKVGKLVKETMEQEEETVPVGDKEVFDFCVQKLNSYDTCKELVSGLTRCGTRISGWEPKNLMAKLIEHESKTKSRQNILAVLNRGLTTGKMISFVNVPFDPKKHYGSEVIFDARLPVQKQNKK